MKMIGGRVERSGTSARLGALVCFFVLLRLSTLKATSTQRRDRYSYPDNNVPSFCSTSVTVLWGKLQINSAPLGASQALNLIG